MHYYSRYMYNIIIINRSRHYEIINIILNVEYVRKGERMKSLFSLNPIKSFNKVHSKIIINSQLKN